MHCRIFNSILGLIAQVVKNRQECRTRAVRFLGQEDPLEKGSSPLQYSGLENSIDSIIHGVAKSGTRLSDFHSVSYPLEVPRCDNQKCLLDKRPRGVKNYPPSQLRITGGEQCCPIELSVMLMLSRLSNTVTTSHTGLLSTRNVAGTNEDLNF